VDGFALNKLGLLHSCLFMRCLFGDAAVTPVACGSGLPRVAPAGRTLHYLGKVEVEGPGGQIARGGVY